MSPTVKNILIGLLAAAWFILVNALFFLQRAGHSSIVRRCIERLGS
jgi:hypothetical protein